MGRRRRLGKLYRRLLEFLRRYVGKPLRMR